MEHSSKAELNRERKYYEYKKPTYEYKKPTYELPRCEIPRHHHHRHHHLEKVEIIEPCVYKALKMLRGQRVCISTTCGKYRGTLVKVKKDHVVIDDCRCIHFIRTSEIVAVTPEPKC